MAFFEAYKEAFGPVPRLWLDRDVPETDLFEFANAQAWQTNPLPRPVIRAEIG